MIEDVRGLAMSTNSTVAAERYNEAVVDFLNYRLVAGKRVKSALEADPEFVLAQCFRASLMLMLETDAIVPRINKTIADLRSRYGDVTRREQRHIDALRSWAAGDIVRASAIWEQILYADPHDLLALKLHHYLMFWTGQQYVLRSTVESVFDAWGPAVPGFCHVLGMYAFALEECGEYAKAENLARQSIEQNGEDLWAIHALAHVLEMQDRTEEGIALLDRPLTDWADRNPFQAHVWWHGALFLLARGRHDQILAYYDERLTIANTEQFMDVANMASLLKRCELRGIDVGHRWDALAEHAAGRTGDHFLAFNDVHFCLSLAAGGRTQAGAEQLASMRAFSGTPDNFTAATMTPVTIPLCEAIVAYQAEDFGEACKTLWPIRHDLAMIGGSHAQRDLFMQILVDAAIKNGQYDMAGGLLRERLARKPNASADRLAYDSVLSAFGGDLPTTGGQTETRHVP